MMAREVISVGCSLLGETPRKRWKDFACVAKAFSAHGTMKGANPSEAP